MINLKSLDKSELINIIYFLYDIIEAYKNKDKLLQESVNTGWAQVSEIIASRIDSEELLKAILSTKQLDNLEF